MRVGSETEMRALGARLSRHAKPGWMLRLIGPLGAGKTTLARGFLVGLGHKGDVRSPTFNLMHEYETEPPVCHVDLFRLSSPVEISELGLTDYYSTHTMLIEWAERAEGVLPAGTATLFFEIEGDARIVTPEGVEL